MWFKSLQNGTLSGNCTIIHSAIASGFISWSANFKPILFALDNESVTFTLNLADQSFSFRHFWSKSMITKIVWIAKLFWLYTALWCIYLWILFSELENALVCAILNMELDLPSDQPYFSTSLQDF
ncbi:uncharacterized protein [Euphorbia lathyris]|uniref:uncharacterized protein n=1 Tax=Euphorbia lathyris TaxID=212925 RepID=UPI0033138BEA